MRCLSNSPLELIAAIEAQRPPAWDLLNGGIVGYDERLRRVTMEWTAATRHCHSVPEHPRGGIVQGGIVAGWLDAAMASACQIEAPSGTSVASLEIKVTFILAAHPGIYRSYGTIVRIGRTIAFLEAELYDGEDRLIAKATSTAAMRAAK